uniref:Uncharacterized protein n=1 Tax=Timema genevievae TaxID=629358 RepID=A0A7R9K672_TIMGE|nr:unnamed protein product [Timema genevievae]
MEGETPVKIEPEEDLGYNLHQEEKFEIKSEVDLQIKSEEGFKEEFNDYQQPECWPGPTSFLPIKEELSSDIDLPIKSEKGLKEELNYYQEAECLPVPFLPIKGELPPCPKYGYGLDRSQWLMLKRKSL